MTATDTQPPSTGSKGSKLTRPGLVLALVCAGQFMVVLDIAIVNVALPSIQIDLGVSQSDLQWAVVAYGLFLGGFLLLGGRSADLLGRRKVFMTGMVIFAGASLLAGLANSLTVLVVARGIQGFGAALAASAALAILTATFKEGPERTKALGVWAGVSAFGATAGVILSGVLTDSVGWEWIFFINVPLGIALAVAALMFLSESRGEAQTSFDFAGAITVTAGLLLLVLAVNKSEDWGWGDGRTLGSLGAALALLAAFVVIESRVREPLVPLHRVVDRIVGTANILAALVFGSFFVLIFIGTLLMQQVLGYSALEAGVGWLATSLTGLVAAAITGTVLVEKFGARPVLFTGLVVLAGSMFGLAQADPGSSYIGGIFPFFFLAGLGIGLCFPSVQVAAFTGFTDRDSGLASGLVNTSQEVGGAISVAVLATIAVGLANDAIATGTEPVTALAEGFQRSFYVAAVIAIVGAVLALTLGRAGPQTAPAAEAETLEAAA